MWNKFINSDFFKKWAHMLNAILGPGSIISLGVAMLSVYLSIKYRGNIPFSNLMVVTGSVFGGIFGTFFKDEYDKISGNNILEKKGRSALRNLQGINTQLLYIKTWVRDFLKKTKKQEDKRNLEEINRHVSTIELNIDSGLEDWVDIVPELKERNQKEIEIDKKYKEVAQSIFAQLLENRKELATTKNEKLEQEIKKKISDLENQIKELKKERPQIVGGIGLSGSVFGKDHFGITSFGNNNNAFPASYGSKKCVQCGKSFIPNYLSVSPFSIYGNEYCDDCKKELSN